MGGRASKRASAARCLLGVACMHVVRCALCHLCCEKLDSGGGGHRHSHARLAGRPRERQYRAWRAMPEPRGDWQRQARGTCIGVPRRCPWCPWLGNEVPDCKPARPCIAPPPPAELLCCCAAVVPGPQLAGRSASQQASRPAMRDGHGLSLLREGGRGAWKFVSMHPWAWADADPQLQGWDLDGRCPGLGGPDWVMTCTCNQQLLLLLLPPCCHPAATPNLAPATGAGRARARFVMLFLIPKSTCEVARRMDGLHTTSVSPR